MKSVKKNDRNRENEKRKKSGCTYANETKRWTRKRSMKKRKKKEQGIFKLVCNDWGEQKVKKGGRRWIGDSEKKKVGDKVKKKKKMNYLEGKR